MKQSTDKKVAVFLADGCEEIEALTVIDLLYRAGIPHQSVSITDTEKVVSSHGVVIMADTTIRTLEFDSFDMLVLPGGLPGTTNLGNCELLTDQVVRFHKEGRQIAAICAAPSVFAKLCLLPAVRATCNPGFESVLEENGAQLTHERVTVTGNIITSQGMGTAADFGLTIVSHYLGQKTAQDLSEKILCAQGVIFR